MRRGLEPHRRKKKRMDFVNDLTRIVRDVQRVVIAMVDDAGMPETRAVEMLDADAEGLYFIVDRTTAFYAQLAARKSLAFTGVQGASYGECATVTLRGRVEEMGSGLVLPLLEKNEAVFEFYKNEELRKNHQEALVFHHRRLRRLQGVRFEMSRRVHRCEHGSRRHRPATLYAMRQLRDGMLPGSDSHSEIT